VVVRPLLDCWSAVAGQLSQAMLYIHANLLVVTVCAEGCIFQVMQSCTAL
jgi:hypothetical protein